MDQTPRFINPRTVLAVTALFATAPIYAGNSAFYSGHYNGSSDTASRAVVRLQQRTDEAMAKLNEGREQYKSGEYVKALESFKSGLKSMPDAPMTATRREYAQKLVTTGSIAVAQQYRKTGRYDEAETILNDILSADPTNKAAKKELGYLKDPIRTNPALTPQHVENVKEVNTLLHMAYGYYNLGQYDKAKTSFEKVLNIDPYNTAARRGMETVDNAKMKYYNEAYNNTRSQMLSAVTAAWEIPVPKEAPTVQGASEGSTALNQTQATLNLMKLKNIIIPSVDFDNTTVEEAIDFLRTKSRQLDNSGEGEKGINFVIQKGSTSTSAPTPTTTDEEDEEGDEGETTATATAPSAGSAVIPELKLRNVPLIEVLKSITQSAGMRYKVEDYAVVILPTGGDDADLFSRSFPVPPTFHSSLQNAASGGAGGSSDSDPFASDAGDSNASGFKAREPVIDLLKKMGVPFPPGATATFFAGSGTLVVRNTPSSLDTIETIIESIAQEEPRQVKITTKFVEVSQDNTDELSFDWIVSPIKVGGAQRYIGGGTQGNGTATTPGDWVGAPNGVNNWVDGIGSSTVTNTVTSGNRSGDSAISKNALNNLINNPNRTSATDSVAPGIMSFSGIFDQGSLQMIMRGLSQKKGTDVLTAPSVTAKTGETAKIEIVRQFIYPEDYSEPQLPNSVGSTYNNGNNDNNNDNTNQASVSTFPVTPATPVSWSTRNVGVTLEIQPDITQGTSLINFRFEPEIVEFEGFINYGSPISTAGIDSEGNPTTVVITENRIEKPVFSRRLVQTNLALYDGYTVAIGGLMQESVQTVEDKVPVLGDIPLLGRLFRSEASNHVKSNLIIFVTGDIIDATGRAVRNIDDNASESPAATPVSAEEGLLPSM